MTCSTFILLSDNSLTERSWTVLGTLGALPPQRTLSVHYFTAVGYTENNFLHTEWNSTFDLDRYRLVASSYASGRSYL